MPHDPIERIRHVCQIPENQAEQKGDKESLAEKCEQSLTIAAPNLDVASGQHPGLSNSILLAQADPQRPRPLARLPILLGRHTLDYITPESGTRPEPIVPLVRRLFRELLVHIAQSGNLEVRFRFVGRPDEGEPASFGQDHDQVTGCLDVGQAVCNADHRFAAVRHFAKQFHHFAIGLFVESGCHFVKE